MKKLLSIILAILMLEASLCFSVSALETNTGTLNIMSYNVSGIPILGDFQGTQTEFKGNARMAKIGEILNNESGCEIIGTQEDFNHHDALAKAMPDYNYQSLSSGGAPLGDGLAIFSKFPVYNVKHTKWNISYGILSGASDRLAQKGILSSVIEIADGVYIDFYVLHAEAGSDPESGLARTDNFRQLAEMINTRENDRAVIVAGDYNAGFVHRAQDGLYDNLIEPTGLKDCWAEVYNNGNYNYNGGIGWNPSLYETVDRVMFKSGGGVELSAEALQYIQYTNEKGETYTDHIATKVSINYEITGDTSTAEVLQTEKPINRGQRFLDEFTAVIKTLFLVLTDFKEIFSLIGEGIDYLKQH